MTQTYYIILAVLALIIIWVITSYNRLVVLVNRGKEAWATIDSQLKRRYDLIPNLVETVKGYAKHEASTFDNVIKARAAALSATGPADRVSAENALSGTLKSLFAISEAYPDLKANQNFLQLQRELGDTEDKILAARNFYNMIAASLNTALESFPNNIIASRFGFAHMELFTLSASDAARDAVKVTF